MKEMIFNVEGMMCEGCENRVKNAVGSIDGVIDVSAKHDTGIVKVIARENVTEDIVREKIEDIGFTPSVKE